MFDKIQQCTIDFTGTDYDKFFEILDNPKFGNSDISILEAICPIN